ncbi:MAG: LPS assembly protein LptD [Phycisphaeraceae bacterium]|nr:LPS assembly protein LptD [Phycisphaeraceae bacterium]
MAGTTAARAAACALTGVCGAPIAIVAGVIACVGVAAPAGAQAIANPTGRDFAGIRLNIPVVWGSIGLKASRASVWTEAGSPPTRRLLLDDGVVVTLGDSVFQAKRAVVWLTNVQPIGETGGEYQVFVVFEDVGSPAAVAGPQVAASWLAVQGIVRSESRPSLSADLVTQGRPGDRIVERAEAELAAQLRRVLGLAPLADGGTGPEEDGRLWRPVPVPTFVARVPEAGEAGGVAGVGNERGVATLPDRVPVGVPAGVPTAPGQRPGEVTRLPGATVPRDATGVPAPERVISEAEAAAATERFRDAISTLPPTTPTPVIAPRTGVVTVGGAERAVVQGGAEETTIVIDGGVVIQSTDERSGRTMLLKADRAVIFHDPGSVQDLATLDREKFRGVYLEGAVMATDGQYTLRGHSVYYDLRSDRAIVLDGVFNTYNEQLRMPLYLRADVIRQEAVSEFTAENPRLATSAFNRPLLTLGASTITLRRLAGGSGITRNIVEADDLTLRAGSLPFFYWPTYSGEPERVPLRGIGLSGIGGGDGALRTTWDAMGLLGIDPPSELDAELRTDLLVDWYFERGLAGGLDADWKTDRGEGSLLAYGIFNDVGEDRLNSGARVGRDGDTRGMVLGEHRWIYNDLWTFTSELAYIGDETFVDAFFDRDGETRREFATGVTAQRLESNTAVTITARGSLNDFSANEYIQAGPGYTTERLPEFRYVRLADDLFPQRYPGLVIYSLDARGGYNRLNFTEPTAAELGYTRVGRSRAAFGIDPDQSIADRLRSEGYFEDGVWRFDARHELSSKVPVGPVNINPFVVGRTTFYDTDFQEFSPEEDDNARLWGAAGVTASTSIQRVDNGAESRLFDVHRIRHIIEPRVTVFHAASNIDSTDLPIYDDDVEGLAEGTTVRVGVDQTFQTQRGSFGQFRSVDFFTVDAEIIWNDDDQDRESLIPRFFEPRPELSDPGTFGRVDATWQATESLGLSTEWIYSFDSNQPARISAGYIINHTPQLTTSGEIRFLNPQDVTYADFAWLYNITDKYAATGSVSFDVDEGDFRRARVGVRREFPAFYFRVDLVYDNIQDETSISVNLLPIRVPTLDRDLD